MPPSEKQEVVCHDPDGVLTKIPLLAQVVRELVKNCVEEEAGEITVTVKPGEIIIEDDLHHDDPRALVEKLNNPKPKSGKRGDQRVTGKTRGGIGIAWSRDLLKRSFGKESNIVYELTEDQRIRAIATWPARR